MEIRGMRKFFLIFSLIFFIISIHFVSANIFTDFFHKLTAKSIGCEESWECGSWSFCEDNLQVRVCVDKNFCGTEINKPFVEFDCTEYEIGNSLKSIRCDEWGECIDGSRTRSCDKLNLDGEWQLNFITYTEFCGDLECEDSDGGINYGTYGYVTFGNSQYKDTCTSRQYWDGEKYVLRYYLYEQYCEGNEKKSREVYCGQECSYGICYGANENFSSPDVSGEEDYCEDSDGGKNYYEKGEIVSVINSVRTSYSDSSGRDVDLGTEFVHEWYCEGNEAKFVKFTCPIGIVDGACIFPNDADTSVDCYDSDGGKNYGVKGYVSDQAGNIVGIDSCEIYSTLDYYRIYENHAYEWYCENGEAKSEKRVCIGDCYGGVCSDEPFEYDCYDSDGGINYYEKGEGYGRFYIYPGGPLNVPEGVSAYSEPFEDYCHTYDGTYKISEYYCENDGNVDVLHLKTFTCPYRCEDGACIAPPVSSSEPSSASLNDGLKEDSDPEATNTPPIKYPSNFGEDNRLNNSQSYTDYYFGLEGKEYVSPLTSQKFKVSISESKIIGERVEAVSDVALIEENENIYAIDPISEAGETKGVEVKITPDDAVSSTHQAVLIDEVRSIKIQKYLDKIVYSVDSKKQTKILGLFKISADILVSVDIETGEVISVKKPWWGFLATGI